MGNNRKYRWRNIFQRKGNNHNEISEFNALSPTRDADISGYEKALDYVFLNNDIKNIAVSGPYCSGKSSVIESYEHIRHGQIKLLHISLAHFNSSKGKRVNRTNSNSQVESIESKMLNQLIQQVPCKKIKYSRFRIKREAGLAHSVIISVLMCLFVIFTLHVLKFYSWKNLVDGLDAGVIKNYLTITTEPLFRLISAAITIVLLGVVAFRIIRNQIVYGFIKKISYKDTEINLGTEKTDSFFDKHLSEVLYIFEKTDADGIVFEDIDRFERIELFERLREINTLANLGREKEKPLRFFYLMSDEIFVDNRDRTKFFDFVIPVIPVVDGSNSYSKIKEYLEKAGLFHLFDTHFLREISLYIDDNRIVKNIVNELLVYKTLDIIDLDPNKLFAIITYKNTFPKDYVELQFRKGFLFEVFKGFQNYKDNLVEKIGGIHRDELSTLDSLLDAESVSMHRYGDYKKKYLENKNKLSSIETYTLSEVLSEKYGGRILDTGFIKNTDNFLSIIESPNFELIEYLLSNGYIDETYSDYMTIYYDNDISINDKKFIRSVLDRKKKAFDYTIDSPEKVIEVLKPVHFNKPEILNYDLFDYLFSCDLEEQIDNALSLVFFGEYDYFVESYLENGKASEQFAIRLIEKRNEYFAYAVRKEMSRKTLIALSRIIIENCNQQTIKKINAFYGCLEKFISSCPGFLSLDIDKEKLCLAMKNLNVLIQELDFNSTKKDVLDFVYKNNLYLINEFNIRQILDLKMGIENTDSELSRLFTLVLKCENEPFCQYVKKYMPTALMVYLEIYKGKIYDNSETAIFVINSCDNELSKRYIERLKTRINHIENIDDKSLYSVILNSNNVLYSAENIISISTQNEAMTKKFADFINSDQTYLDFRSVGSGIDTNAFLGKVLVSDFVNDDKYIQIVSCIAGKESIKIHNKLRIPECKMYLLIEEKYICFSIETLKLIRFRYVSLLRKFVTKYTENYLLLPSADMKLEEVQWILENEECQDDKKIELLKAYKMPVSIVNKKYSDKIINQILNGNFEQKDLGWLSLNFSKLPLQSKDRAYSLLKNVSFDSRITFNNKYLYDRNIDQELKEYFLRDSSVEFSERIRYFIIYIYDIDRKELCNLLHAFGADLIRNNLIGGNRRVTVNPENKAILDALVSRNIIKNYKMDSTKKHYLKIRYIERNHRVRRGSVAAN